MGNLITHNSVTWSNFLELDRNSFDCIMLLGDVSIVYRHGFKELYAEKPIMGVKGEMELREAVFMDYIENLHGTYSFFEDISMLGIDASQEVDDGEPFTRPLICW